MIITSQEQFYKYVPTALDPDGTNFQNMHTYLRDAEQWLSTDILGAPLYQYLEHAIKTGSCDHSSIPYIINSVEQIISLQAYAVAIPFLDLIQTPNGFAIVNNANLSPASRERIERLIQSATDTVHSTVDHLLTQVVTTPVAFDLFKTGATFIPLTDTFFLCASELRASCGDHTATRSTLTRLKPLIYEAQNTLQRYISTEYQQELLNHWRNQTLNPREAEILPLIRQFIGHYINQKPNHCQSTGETLSNYIERYPDDFPTYFSSVHYRLKTAQHYTNKPDDTTFFFG